MSEYINELIWLCSWPFIIYVSYKFVVLNIKQNERMEKIEEKN